MKNQATTAAIPHEELQRAAYLNYMDRTSKGLPGSESDDWEKARLELEGKTLQSKSAGRMAKAPRPSSGDISKTVKSGAGSLRLLAGLGPKIEERLREAGIRSLKQVAAWTETEIAVISKRLKLGNRIVRDRWVEQAKSLLKK